MLQSYVNLAGKLVHEGDPTQFLGDLVSVIISQPNLPHGDKIIVRIQISKGCSETLLEISLFAFHKKFYIHVILTCGPQLFQPTYCVWSTRELLSNIHARGSETLFP